tara:strand:- start:3255 stop:3530 length:276 start_codon:yes stop_codon:yes gene_type:complete
MTQAEEASRRKMPLGAYKRAELDDTPECWLSHLVAPGLGRLHDFESCFVLRKRSAMTLDDLSAKIGLSKWWLCLIEQGRAPAATLVDYWTK